MDENPGGGALAFELDLTEAVVPNPGGGLGGCLTEGSCLTGFLAVAFLLLDALSEGNSSLSLALTTGLLIGVSMTLAGCGLTGLSDIKSAAEFREDDAPIELGKFPRRRGGENAQDEKEKNKIGGL